MEFEKFNSNSKFSYKAIIRKFCSYKSCLDYETLLWWYIEKNIKTQWKVFHQEPMSVYVKMHRPRCFNFVVWIKKFNFVFAFENNAEFRSRFFCKRFSMKWSTILLYPSFKIKQLKIEKKGEITFFFEDPSNLKTWVKI